MKFNKIKKIIILGGSRLVAEFAPIAKEKYDLVVWSAKRHLDEVVTTEGKTLREVFDSHSIKYYDSPDINRDKRLNREVTENSIGIAMGAAWVFEKPTVSLFSEFHLLDFMGIDLPRYRGGAHYTWQILHKNKKGVANLQIIYGGRETFHGGDIVKRKEYNLSDNVKRPIDYFNDCLKEEIIFLNEFFDEIENNNEFNMSKLNEAESSYYPFLSSIKNGLINWNWSAEDINLFISAFDEPYTGATTFLNGKKVFLKNSKFKKSSEHYHPFTAGLIVRKNEKEIVVAALGGLIEVGSVLNGKNNDIKNFLKLGDRFFTPAKELEKSLKFKAVYTAVGLKKK